MYFSLSISVWLTLLITPLAGGLRVRIFIIFHDCGHGSFFKSKKANDILGSLCGLLTLTPYYQWRHTHSLHHANSGVLEKRLSSPVVPMSFKKYLRDSGDVLTLTVKEYRQLTAFQRLVYRVYRHPVMLFLVLPALYFVVLQRFASPKAGQRERYSIYGTNLAILAVIVGVGSLIGFGPYLLVESMIILVTTTVGGWLFYVQHHFEQTYWQPSESWDFAQAALQGSSYYKLPLLLQWFTGNIGFHHIHHLSPRVPNYYLPRCHKASDLFRQTRAITFWAGMRSIFSNLWDEEQQKMVAFAHLKTRVSSMD